ncbi:MAG: SpoIIE family protein phosphatase [Holosporaceae bacterium]|jgi:sigma-B regulation protein RsbU (phosphoserine phosphatase)|nr:SpoIIE family protein phosphatase [Holosporaceae bacterium]
MATLANILVLDDEEDTEDLVRQYFRHQISKGLFEFSFAKCHEESLDLLKRQAFDIFVSDINVAGMDGISFIAQLRRKYPLMRSVVISAYGDINTLRAAMRGGAHDFVIKPIDFKDFSDTLNKTADVVKKLKQSEATTKKLSAISDELDVSAKLQRSMLPGNVVRKGGLEIWADTVPAAEVGGDFYDFFWLSDTKLGVVMADVSGKNVSAAMFALIGKTLIKSFSKSYPSPAECFKYVNKSLCAENVATMFITAMYGIFDLEKNELLYTNAGHLPVVSIRPNADPIFLECDPGMALGIWEETAFVDNAHSFSPGEMILLYTDGVTEAANKEGDEYDKERFLEVLKKNSTAIPKALTEALIASIREFTKGTPQSDDITTLCLKYRLRVAPNVS